MKRLFLLLMTVTLLCVSTMAFAADPADVIYDQKVSIQDRTFTKKVTFDRKESFRVDGVRVIALPGKGKHWMEVNAQLPENSDMYITMEPKWTKDTGYMESRIDIGRCSFTLREYKNPQAVKIEKRGDTILFNGMQAEQCGGDKLRVTTMPGSRVYEIQDLIIVKK